MKDKTNLKLVITALVSIIVSSSITAFAAIKFQANEIGYNTTTVADALDGMYKINSFQTDYSTEEKVVGKWMNGKPIYQKSFSFTLSSGATIDVTNLNIDELVNITGKATHTNGNQITIPYAAATNDYVQLYLASNHNYINCALSGSWNSNIPSYVTIQYTKTTDQPNNN